MRTTRGSGRRSGALGISSRRERKATLITANEKVQTPIKRQGAAAQQDLTANCGTHPAEIDNNAIRWQRK